MKKLLILISLTMANGLYAEEFFTIPSVKYQLQAPNALTKLDDTLNYPEKLLKRFKPEGATITNKEVSNNHITFNATKTVLFISKTVRVNGVLDSVLKNSSCAKNEKGYELTLSLDGSDGIVLDNIDRLEASICFNPANQNVINGLVKAKVFKGRNYSTTTGSIARGIIEAQVTPLFKALSDEIKSMK